MFRKLTLFITLSLFLLGGEMVFAQSSQVDSKMSSVAVEYSRGNYEGAIVELEKLKAKDQKEKGLFDYWRGMSYSRLNDFENATKYLRSAIDLGFETQDLFYEYGQALYVSSEYKNARIAFKKSFNRKYKRGVSLYYIAVISREMNETKKAVKFFNMISKLPEEEKRDVLQASKVQIADIYLEKIETLPDSIKDIEKYVIPQYRSALEVNEDSKLAEEVKTKIEELQKRYELVLFRMRNGRPTSRPPYYLRANLTYGTDSNVNLFSNEQVDNSDINEVASPFVQAGVFGRYSLYPSSAFSFAPEINVTTTKYLSDSESIEALNAYAISTGATMNFEHMYNDSAATFYVNFAYTYNANFEVDEDAYTYTGNELALTLSEELRFWKDHPSTFRFRIGNTTTEDATASFNSYALSWEQIVNMSSTILFFTNSYTVNTFREVEVKEKDNNAFTTRLDSIFPTFFGLFNPTLYVSYTSKDFFESSSTGTQKLTSYGINVNRPLSRNFYLTLDYSINTQQAKLDEDNYTQNIITVNLDYIY